MIKTLSPKVIKPRLSDIATKTSATLFSFALLLGSQLASAQVGNLLWEDNFDTLNPDHWTVDEGDGCDIGLCGWGNQELQWYSGNNVSIQSVPGESGNNALVLEARNDGSNGYSFTSGKIQSHNKVAIQYGMIEVRLRVPNLDAGLWPAAWMLGTSTLPWPNKGEIDMMEMGHSHSVREEWRTLNADPNDDNDPAPAINNHTGSNLIYYSEGACVEGNPTCAASTAWQTDNVHVSSQSLANRFVTYRTYWTESEIRFTVEDNGVEYDMYDAPFQITPESSAFQAPFYLLLNLAVGGTFTGLMTPGEITAPMSGPMYVDYVRVYEYEGRGEVTLGNITEPETGTFGVFTDNSLTTNKLEPGVTSAVYLWDPNSSEGSIAPYEGEYAIAWSFDVPGTWFGGGVQTYQARDMSNFEDGEVSFYINIPADISFRIGITDTYTNENWITFPAGENMYGLVRNGNWGKVTIPVDDLRGPLVAIQSLEYLFAISSDPADLPTRTFEYAIDDVLWLGGGNPPADSDGDGVIDDNDQCPNTPAGTEVDSVGCPLVIIQPGDVLVEAEDYVAFADSDSGNNGTEYRDDDVDIQASSDTGGGYNVGWTNSGEWLEYDLEIAAGTYEVTARVASNVGGGAYTLSLDGNTIGSDNVADTGGWQAWETHSLGDVTIGSSDTYTLRVDISSGAFNLNWIEFTVKSAPVDSDGDGLTDDVDACPHEYAQTPDGCPEALVTVTVQAEDYSAFSDSDAGNNGTEYRDDDVDIQVSSDTDGGYNVGWTNAGEWLEYTVNLDAGTYSVIARVASNPGNASYSVSLDGTSVGSADVASTGGWQNWEDQTVGQVTVSSSGDHTLRVDIDQGGFNLNWIRLEATAIVTPTPTPTPVAVTIQAEDYSNFSDSDSGNNGGQYRSDDVDIEISSDSGGGYNIGWTITGEWLEYNVNLEAGSYDVIARVASIPGGASLAMDLSGTSVGSVNIASTGGWQNWVDQTVGQVNVSANGAYTLRLDITAGGFNLNWIHFEPR